jgi:hypothetical protein
MTGGEAVTSRTGQRVLLNRAGVGPAAGAVVAPRLLPSFLRGPLNRWHALVLTALCGPLALLSTIAGLVGLIVAPPAGLGLLFGSIGLWFLVIVPWWALLVQRRISSSGSGRRPGLPPSSDQAPDAAQAISVSITSPGPERVPDWRTLVRAQASGAPAASAVQLRFRVPPSQHTDCLRHARLALDGLRDAGVIDRPGAALEAWTAELTVAGGPPHAHVSLVRPEAVATHVPSGRPAVSVTSAVAPHEQDTDALQRRLQQARQECTGQRVALPLFLDVAVRDEGDPHAVLETVVRGLETCLDVGAGSVRDGVRWLRWQRFGGLPAAVLVARGERAPDRRPAQGDEGQPGPHKHPRE